MTLEPKQIDALAELFTDSSVVTRHSISLQGPPSLALHREAQLFFKARSALGIHGYVKAIDAARLLGGNPVEAGGKEDADG